MKWPNAARLTHVARVVLPRVAPKLLLAALLVVVALGVITPEEVHKLCESFSNNPLLLPLIP